MQARRTTLQVVAQQATSFEILAGAANLSVAVTAASPSGAAELQGVGECRERIDGDFADRYARKFRSDLTGSFWHRRRDFGDHVPLPINLGDAKLLLGGPASPALVYECGPGERVDPAEPSNPNASYSLVVHAERRNRRRCR